MAKKYMIFIEQHGMASQLLARPTSSKIRAASIASGQMKSLKEVFTSYLGYEQKGSFSKDAASKLVNEKSGHTISIRISEIKDGAEYLDEGLNPMHLKVDVDEKRSTWTNSIDEYTITITHLPTNVSAMAKGRSGHKARAEAMSVLREILANTEF